MKVLWGDVNPSGRLPYTIPKKESDYGFVPITNSSALLNTSDPNAWQSNYMERLLIDYSKQQNATLKLPANTNT